MLSCLCFYNRNKNIKNSEEFVIEKLKEFDIENSNVCVFDENLSEISLESSLYRNSLGKIYLYYDSEESIIQK